MALYITRRPEKTVGTKVSRWGAIHNPYIFELTRKDYMVINTTVRPAYNPDYPAVQTDALPADLAVIVQAGDNIYLNSGIYEGTFLVEDVIDEFIIINTPDIGTGGSGWVNFPEVLLNYKTFINVYGPTDLVSTLWLKPDSTGLIMADVSGVIKSTIETRDIESFININERDDELSGQLRIGYGAMYKIGDVVITNTETLDGFEYYWVSAAMQVDGKTVLGMAGKGQNMAVHVPFNESGSAAKFLTMFEKPVMFEGYPFSISFIYGNDFFGGEGFDSYYLERHQQNYNINRQVTSAESDQTLLVTGVEYVNGLMLADPDATTTEMDVWLEVAGVVVDGYVDSGGLESGSVDLYAEVYSPSGGFGG